MNKALKISIIVVICLIVILGVALLISQCSAKDPEPTDTTPIQTTTSQTTPVVTTPSQTTPSQTTPTETTPTETTPADDPSDDPSDDPVTFTETNDRVYVITFELNVRSTPEIPEGEDNAVSSVFMDTELKRVGYYSNGWSKIVYNGQECYVGTAYVTTQKPVTEFTAVEETVYFTKNAYAYTKPSHLEGYSEQIDTLYTGKAVVRLGVATQVYVGDDGKEYTFAKIKYTVKSNDVDVEVIRYVNNAYLTTELPDPDAGIAFEENNDILVVIAPESISLRKTALWIKGDDEHNAAQVGGHAFNGNELQATHKGTESDGTVWYKVVVEDTTYYVIFDAANLKVKVPAAE